jgi:hypothetical protein
MDKSLSQQTMEAAAEIEAEESAESGSQQDGGEGGQEVQADAGNNAGAAPQPADKDLEGLTANRPVPYDRFKKVIDARKEAERKAKEFEDKYKGVDADRYHTMDQGTQKLIAAVQKHPFLDSLLSDLLDEKQPNWQAVYEEIKKFIPNANDAASATSALLNGQAKAPAGPDPKFARVEEQVAQLQYRLQTQEYEKVVDRQLNEISQDKELKSLTPEDRDEVLKEALLEHQLTGKIPDLVQIARGVQKRIKAIEERILKGQVDNAGRKKNAGGERGGGSAGAEKKRLNPNSPSFSRDVANMAESLLEEEG